MDEWMNWPPGWPQEQRVMLLRQTCRRCGRELRNTVGRPVPGIGWMHKDCAIALVAERHGSGDIYALDMENEPEVEESC